MARVLLLAALLAAVALVAAESKFDQRHALFEWRQHPRGWRSVGRAPRNQVITFGIALPPANIDKLEAFFWDVSNPDSPNYQKYLTVDEVLAMTNPGDAVRGPVVEWLKSEENVKVKVLGENLLVEAPVRAVENLFRTRMLQYENEANGKRIIRQMGTSSIPTHLSGVIKTVEGVFEFPPRRHRVDVAPGKATYSVNVISTYRKIYGLPNTTITTNASNGVFAQQAADGSPKQSDLLAFDTNTNTPPQKFNYNGSPDPTIGLEATLDIQTMTSVAPNGNTTFFMQQNWMYVFTTYLLSLGQWIPDAISVSYGWNEDQQCSDILHDLQICTSNGWNGTQYITAVNNNLMKLGAVGTTFMASSGDNGAPGDQNVGCSLDSKQALYPAYPASSPYLLSVGATEIIGSGTGIDEPQKALGPACTVWPCSENVFTTLSEQPAQTRNASFSTGGGFSQVQPQPSYQADAVQDYLTSGVPLPPSTKFNAQGRGYPDVSAIGQNNIIVEGGRWTVSGGTSASSPLWAGVITQINNYLLQNGKPTLGFVNPLLYKIAAANPNAFNAITAGDNKCTEQACCSYGFVANPKGGWSPMTGLGSPVYPQIISYINQNIINRPAKK